MADARSTAGTRERNLRAAWVDAQVRHRLRTEELSRRRFVREVENVVAACRPDLSGGVVELDEAYLLKQGAVHRRVADQERACERLGVGRVIVGRCVITAKLNSSTGAEIAMRLGDVVMGDLPHLFAVIVDVGRAGAGVVPGDADAKAGALVGEGGVALVAGRQRLGGVGRSGEYSGRECGDEYELLLHGSLLMLRSICVRGI